MSKVFLGTTQIFHLSFLLMTLILKLKFVKKTKHNLRSRVFANKSNSMLSAGRLKPLFVITFSMTSTSAVAEETVMTR